MLKRVLTICMIGLIAFSFIPLSMINLPKQETGLKVREGVMDLALWDSEAESRIRLDGDWEFYWNQLLSPDDFVHMDAENSPSPPAYVKVPSSWTGKAIDGKPLPAYGYATYRMVLKNVPASGGYALKKTNIRFSSAIYINGEKLAEDGLPAADKEGYQPGNVPQFEVFHLDQGEAEIIVQIANYDYVNAGIAQSLYFGEQEAMLKSQHKTLTREIVVLTILGILAIIYIVYFIAAALYGNRDDSLLIYAFICSLYAIYHGLMGERSLLMIIPDIPFELMYRMKDISSFVCLIALAVFVHKFQKNILTRRQTWVASSALACFSALAALVPIRAYTSLQAGIVLLYEVMLIWILVKSAALYCKSSRKERLNSLLFFMAVLTMNLYSIDIILFAVSMKESMWLTQLYIIAFNVIMLFLVVLRFFEAYHTVNEMKNRLLEVDKLKDDFLSTTSHELKTPLHAIVNITDTLLKGVDGPVSGDQAQNLAIVRNSGRRLTHLVNELLDFSKMKHGDLTLNVGSIDLKSAVDSVIRMHVFLLDNKPIRLNNLIADPSLAVRADGNRLMQILHNIIGNAVKFTDAGEISVSARIVRDQVEICVKDTGIGIDSDLHQHIFQPFQQADSSMTRRYDGTGLGLSITKKLVELHGGVISIDSSVGQGTTIAFTLPRSTHATSDIVEQKEMQWREKPHSASSSKYPIRIRGEINEPILVVDDDDANLQAMLNLLRLEGHTAVIVNRGQAALEELSERNDFSLVILDIMMPDMSGYEVLQKIRERYSPFELPVLMLTAKSRASDVRLAMEYGANDIVGKPLESEEVMARVKSLTRLKASVKNATNAELAFLRSQINPHFLYNALNAIASLCVEEPYKAEQLTLQLSQYLRSSFDFKKLDAMSPLRSELELVQAYVYIEKARFGERLQVEYDVHANRNLRIPPLLLQPIVENAIRHGLMTHRSGGKVSIIIKETQDGTVSFTVEDNGGGMSETRLQEVMNSDFSNKGVGLWNISRRLKLHYGSGLRIESKEGSGTKVSFSINASLTGVRGE